MSGPGVQPTKARPQESRIPELLHGWAATSGYTRLSDTDGNAKPTPDLNQKEQAFLSGAVSGLKGHNHVFFTNGNFKHSCPIIDCQDHHPTTFEQQYKRFGTLPFLIKDPFFQNYPAKEASIDEVRSWLKSLYEFKHRTMVFEMQYNVDTILRHINVDGKELRQYASSRHAPSDIRFLFRNLGMDQDGAEYMAAVIIRARLQSESTIVRYGNMFFDGVASIPGMSWVGRYSD